MVPGDVLESPLLRSLDDGDRRALALFLDRMSTAPGDVVLEQGARDRDMYFLMSGTVSLRRGDVEIGTLGPGQHFGELGLVADRARAISVVATTPGELARLTLAAFGRLSAAAPALSLRFVSKLVGGLGVRHHHLHHGRPRLGRLFGCALSALLFITSRIILVLTVAFKVLVPLAIPIIMRRDAVPANATARVQTRPCVAKRAR